MASDQRTEKNNDQSDSQEIYEENPVPHNQRRKGSSLDRAGAKEDVKPPVPKLNISPQKPEEYEGGRGS